MPASPEERHGFVLYRTAYANDAQWTRFMAYLKHQVQSSLERENIVGFFDRIYWKVVNADPDDGTYQIRNGSSPLRHFNTWLNSGEEKVNLRNYSYLACVLVVQPFLDFVDEWVGAKTLGVDDVWDEHGATFVEVVPKHEEEGDVLVGISRLIPRADEFIEMGWECLAVPVGEVALP
ncbi:hypothetical protein BU23DRAFT_597123 [Bimuria novae-zelandiae CBS 107.79]|uniref:Uncharacterized protein n=1 Tax=Bimuria novae-zelandiae CBS 107.79 TaxID=1447943 RepID=A0A6A5VHV5_9PLEO|nr:hypothetical protein BU23DRAFT_597123 [Bimuria novae-zelandiae CBS 107.79]